MKKLFTLVTAVLLATLLLAPTESKASHATAADITYQYVGPNQYLVTLRFYRDCEGIPAPTTGDITYTSSCFPSGFASLPLLPGSGQQIPTSPCVPQVVTTCNGGTGYGIQEYVYQGVVTLPGQCVDWRFEYSMCCRNTQITTVTNAASFNIYVSTTLDNFNFPTNSSPVFSNIPVTQFCIGNQFYYQQGATDVDGDSLVFSLDIAENALGASVTYAAPYGALYPLASSTPITINSQTGTISFTPSMLQVGVIAIKCEEYRNGVKIGQIKRDMQMKVVSTCIGTAPFVVNPTGPGGITVPYTASCGDTAIYIVLDQPVQCGSIVNTDIRIVTPQGLPNPVLSAVPVNCVNGQTDSILVTFFYPLTAGTTYAFTKKGFDNNTFLSECGVEVPEYDSIAFNVVDPLIFDADTLTVSCAFDQFTINLPYELYCNSLSGNGSEFILKDANGATYPVTASSGCNQGSGNYSNTLTVNFGGTIAPASPMYLLAQNGSDLNTFTNRCNSYIPVGDTMAVLTVVNNITTDLGTDQSACDSGPFPVLDAGLAGTAVYTWYLNGTVISGASTQTISANQSGNYSVVVSYSSACSATDNVNVTITPTPVVTLGSDVSICSTQSLPVFDAGNAGSSYQWYQGGNAISGATAQTYQPSAAGSYSVSVTNAGACTGTDNINLTIIPPVPVALPNDQTICHYDTPPSIDAGSFSGSSYSWTLNGSPVGGNTQILQTTLGGNYSVLVTDANGCTGSDSYSLTVVPAFTFDLGEEIFNCFDRTPIVTITSPSGYSNYSWSLNGSPVGSISSNLLDAISYGTYVLTISDQFTCESTDSVTITELCDLDIPNVFTPGNDDGKNETWQIKNVTSNPNTKVTILNRWGNAVFESSSYHNEWDGGDLPDGTYYYVVVTQAGLDYKGTVKLIRATK